MRFGGAEAGERLQTQTKLRWLAGRSPEARPRAGLALAHMGSCAWEEMWPHGHGQGGGQHPWARQAAPPQPWPHRGATAAPRPSAVCTEAALARHRHRGAGRGRPGLPLQASAVAPRCPAPPSLPPRMGPPGSSVHAWEAAAEVRVAFNSSVTAAVTTGLLAGCGTGPGGGVRTSGAGNTPRSTPHSQLRLGGKPPQSGSGDGTVGPHPDPPPDPMGHVWSSRGQLGELLAPPRGGSGQQRLRSRAGRARCGAWEGSASSRVLRQPGVRTLQGRVPCTEPRLAERCPGRPLPALSPSSLHLLPSIRPSASPP